MEFIEDLQFDRYRDLYFALRTRILTDAEMNEVKQAGLVICIRPKTAFRDHEKRMELNDALFKQAQLRLMRPYHLLDRIPLSSFNEHARELDIGTFTDASLSYRKTLAIEALEKLDRLQNTSTGKAEIDLTELFKIRSALRLGLGIPIH